MPSESHQGGQAPYIGASTDGRVTGLSLEALTTNLFGHSVGRLVSDSFRYMSMESQQLNRQRPLTVGRILHSIPFANSYNVQLADGGGRLMCCLLQQESSTLPMGVRTGSVVPSGSDVIVFKPMGTTYGIILGVLPPDIQSASLWRPSFLVAGGTAGFHRSQAHMQPIRSGHHQGGVRDFSCGSPIDATSMEWTKVSATGIALLIDDFQAFLRVNEACGLFLNLFDNYMRLCGVNFDIWSACFELYSRLDEGEARHEERVSVYPWEGYGYYDQMQPLGEKTDPLDVIYNKAKASSDIADNDKTIQGIYRAHQYKGYLGQGGFRSVMKPARDSGIRRLEDAETDVGLFTEAVALDGSYLLRSAKSIMLVKRGKAPIPKEVKLPEDPLGDSIANGNYQFSGRYGGGPPHQVGDVQIEGRYRSMRRAAAVNDLLSHAFNWKALHPFHYHERDFKLDQEAAVGTQFGLTFVQEPIDFRPDSSGYLADPQPVRLNIDHRYNSVAYYMRESFFCMHDDGTVSIGCGFGAEITMANGKLRLSAPTDIEVLPGGRMIAIGRQLIMKSEESLDFSSSKGDIRFAAANPNSNMQFCAGNMLFDARTDNDVYLFRDRIGEDVVSTGIVFKARTTVAVLAKTIYLRSDVGDSNGLGNIVLDAGVKDKDINLYANRIIGFFDQGINFWHGERNTAPVQTHAFTRDYTILSNNTMVGGNLVAAGTEGRKGNILCDGNILAGENVVAGGGFAAKDGAPFVGKLDDQAISEIEQACQEARDSIQKAVEAGDPLEEQLFDDVWYVSGRIGNEQTIADVAFSYRDDDQHRQYDTADDFKFFETRWQRMARLGQGAGGRPFEETPIPYQGRMLYPWPGREAWLGSTLWGLNQNTFWDGRNATARPGQYESPQLGDWLQMTWATNFMVTD